MGKVEIDEVSLAGLRHAVHSLHTLGLGVDMAFAQQVSVNGDDLRSEGHSRWTPAKSGEKLLQIPAEDFERAESLLVRYGYRYRLRTLDALHLAVALKVNNRFTLKSFVAFRHAP